MPVCYLCGDVVRSDDQYDYTAAGTEVHASCLADDSTESVLKAEQLESMRQKRMHNVEESEKAS